MILGFKQYLDKKKQKPTRFKEQILSDKKKHSIRVDKHNRWRKGMPIQMAYGVRTKQYDCFCNDRECTGTQTIEIEEMIMTSAFYFVVVNDRIYRVKVDGKPLTTTQIVLLSFNDGFFDVDDFINWFGAPYKGKIIHWTNFRY